MCLTTPCVRFMVESTMFNEPNHVRVVMTPGRMVGVYNCNGLTTIKFIECVLFYSILLFVIENCMLT